MCNKYCGKCLRQTNFFIFIHCRLKVIILLNWFIKPRLPAIPWKTLLPHDSITFNIEITLRRKKRALMALNFMDTFWNPFPEREVEFFCFYLITTPRALGWCSWLSYFGCTEYMFRLRKINNYFNLARLDEQESALEFKSISPALPESFNSFEVGHNLMKVSAMIRKNKA